MTPYAGPIAALINELAKLPGVGEKTASRLAFHILRAPRSEADALAHAILRVKDEIRLCRTCYNVTDVDPCRICTDPRRDPTLLCVVEEPPDLLAIEKTREFRGRYHVLHGALNPLEGIGPEALRIRELLERLAAGGEGEGRVREVILATNPNVEGEATAIYLARLLKPLGVAVTRIAHGVPMGGDLEYADEATLARALEGRRAF
ncbi:MAG TPA: recombination mediator RecR [Thermodesulfobacteriota bacterium]|nr:recombination mediator RecR [Thermodesulfobacteriota bacterium]